MSEEKTVKITAELTEAEAWQFAQFLKRSGYSDYEEKTVASLPSADRIECAYLMLYAGEKIRRALDEAGYNPR